jgi:glycosyltransferase involved in cell wall biosynthesis
VDYDDMLYRFADFNAGHYASRNAAFQNAVGIAAKTKLALDGDLIIHGSDVPSRTELATRKLARQLKMDDAEIRRDLERGREEEFSKSKLYRRVFELADEARGKPAPRALVPSIRLKSAKITRNLTTDWFAQRVKTRYEQCLRRG